MGDVMNDAITQVVSMTLVLVKVELTYLLYYDSSLDILIKETS